MSAVHRQFYDVCGTRVVIESDVDQVLERVAMTYAAYAQAEHAGSNAVTVSARTRNGSVEVRDSAGRRAAELTDHAGAAAAALERIARVLTLALADRQLLAVHAAAVVWRGRALLLAGPSGAGKTTLALGLVARGLGLLSDEFALIPSDADVVLPYRRSVHLRPGTPELIPSLGFLAGTPQVLLGGGIRWSLTPDQLEQAIPGCLAAPAPLRHVVLLTGATGDRGAPRLEPERPARAVLELVRGAPAAEHHLTFVIRRLGRALESARCARLHAGQLEPTLDCLTTWLEA